ncbi:MAG TPA: pyridoxamine 5'-phosphate oxidase family protein [Mycobacteriales bacterium]|nr:pyridoxamine 5'-phosphate oxidase family protein [Mycobacteriales bacterium]
MDVAGRPPMAAGYGIATDAEGMLPFDWAEQRLTESRNYWVCTTRADGRPHAMPVWGLWLDGAVFFSTDPGSVKGRNLAARPDAVVHLESGDELVLAEGRVERISGAEVPAEFADRYDEKYGHRIDLADPSFACYRLRPDRVIAWREKDFPTSATAYSP